jgi:general secretion pathway protein L
MIDFDTPIDVLGQKFWRWWLSELSQIVPESLQRLISRRQEALILSIESRDLVVSHQAGAQTTELLRTPIEELNPDHFATVIAQRPKLREVGITLQLSKLQGLRRQFKLPMVAEENLSQVIALEMDRLTPFSKEQVYFASRVLDRMKATRQILVELIVTPRDFLDRTLEMLSDAGWQPASVHLHGDSHVDNYNLIPERYKPKTNKLIEGINIGLTSAILASLILALVLPVWMTRTELLRTQAEIRKTTKSAREVEGLREQADKLFRQAQFLQDKKRSEPILVDALEELSRVIPDGTWLNGLQYANHKFIIQGQSPSASGLLKQIEGSRHFKDVSFVSPVTKDAGNNLERFQIALEVVNGRFSEEAH